ncbi:uncharacterized protein VTP21DRAFT_3956 [Calcarisporiella thermophila]|uniref:uncharacterized protein n=1 Tax=Calcarisporiella thermophila TaxID=911321 RepID=UPI0037427EF3
MNRNPIFAIWGSPRTPDHHEGTSLETSFGTYPSDIPLQLLHAFTAKTREPPYTLPIFGHKRCCSESTRKPVLGFGAKRATGFCRSEQQRHNVPLAILRHPEESGPPATGRSPSQLAGPVADLDSSHLLPIHATLDLHEHEPVQPVWFRGTSTYGFSGSHVGGTSMDGASAPNTGRPSPGRPCVVLERPAEPVLREVSSIRNSRDCAQWSKTLVGKGTGRAAGTAQVTIEQRL